MASGQSTAARRGRASAAQSAALPPCGGEEGGMHAHTHVKEILKMTQIKRHFTKNCVCVLNSPLELIHGATVCVCMLLGPGLLSQAVREAVQVFDQQADC